MVVGPLDPLLETLLQYTTIQDLTARIQKAFCLSVCLSVCLSFWLAGVCVRTDVFFAGTGRRLAMLCFKSCQV